MMGKMNGNKKLSAQVPNLCVAMGALFLGLACVLTPSRALTSDAVEVVDRIVAVVNDEIIVLQEVNSLMKSIEQQVDASSYSTEEKQRILVDMRQTFIDRLVNQKLIVQAAKEVEWLTVSEDEIDASVQRYIQQSNLTEEQFREEIAKEGLTMEDIRTQMKESSLSSSLENYEVASKIVITREDVSQYYEQNSDQYSGQTTYHLRNIFIKKPAGGSASEQAEVEAKLAKISEELASGESFENLARKYSESAYAEEGGELGNFKLEDLSPNLRAAVAPLSPGEATPPLESGDGYQILFVQEIHKEADVPLESVYSEIEAKLYEQQYAEASEAWIEGLRENAHIKIIE
jgi:peptidyl-prolyl cis-trans isomerase SurA